MSLRGATTRVVTFTGRIETRDYRIDGELFTLPNLGLADQLNRNDRPFLPVAEPRLSPPDAAEGAPPFGSADFIAIPKERICWVVGGEPSRAAGHGVGNRSARSVAVLFGTTVIRGVVDVLGNVRLSDYIAAQSRDKPFASLRDAELARLGRGVDLSRLEVLERFDHLTVNLRNNTGIAELATLGRGGRSASDAPGDAP